MDFAAASCRRRRRRLHFRLPLSCANFEFIYHTSLDSLRWSSEAFTRKVQPDSDYSKT